MPNETLVAEIENALSEIVRLGGENERSQIVPNLTVQDANPAQTGFIIVSDDRDGDNILAKKVGSVVYANNDKVNVIFPKGGEAIAFQQGSQSANSGIWEIVPSTSTDIFYDKGNVGINQDVPLLDLHVGPGTQTPVNSTVTGVFTSDVNGSQVAVRGTETPIEAFLLAGITGAGTGTTTNHSFFLAVNNAVKATLDTNGDFGVNTITPDAKIESVDNSGAQLRLSYAEGSTFADFTVDINHDLTIDPTSTGLVKLNATITIPDEIQHESDTDTKLSFTDDDIEFTAGGLSMLKLTEAGQDLITLGPGSGDVDINFNGDMFLQGSDGTFGIGTASPSDLLEVEKASGNLSVKFQTLGASSNSGLVLENDDQAWLISTRGTSTPAESLFIRDNTGAANIIVVTTGKRVGINVETPLATAHIDQDSTTAAIPVLLLDQADLSEEFIDFQTTIGAGNPIDTAAIGTYYGKARVAVNGTFKFVALYNS